MGRTLNKYMTPKATISAIDHRIEELESSFQPTTIVVGAHPKKQNKNKFIQWILIKLFGYELEYKTVMAKTVVIKPEDCPISGDGDITLTFD